MPDVIKSRWHVRRVFAANTMIMAIKMHCWQRCEKETGLITLEIGPLYYDLTTETYSRIVRVYARVDVPQLKKWGDMIEREANRVWCDYQQELNNRKVTIDLSEF